MIWLIGARWKQGNLWSRSVLIDPPPFYDKTSLATDARLATYAGYAERRQMRVIRIVVSIHGRV